MAGHMIRVGHLAKAAQALGLNLSLGEITGADSVAEAFAAMRRERAEAFFVLPEPRIDALSPVIVKQAAQQRLPGMYVWRQYVRAGGLMSYGPNLPSMIRLWASYVDKILRGARPADLPVETPRKYELVLNRRAAQHLGFTFPSSLLLAADEVIA
jgi:putative ABC transport system substrate-binding protein